MNYHNKLILLWVCVALVFLFSTIAASQPLSNPLQLSTEQQLSNTFNQQINIFWDTHAVFSSFQGINNKKVSTVSIVAGNSKAIVINQGRNESVLKYKEVAFDLNQHGYDLFLIDHRGQGFSERLGGDLHRGHVSNFQDYVDDFNSYINSLDLKKHYLHRYLLSHSMGGAISALYLEQYKHPFQASAFLSPMFSINLGGIPNSLAKIIMYSSDQVCSWFDDKPCYVFAGGSYDNKTFIDNDLCSSERRFNSAQATFVNHPETQLGSPTMHWLVTSISATEQAIKNSSKINIPVLIIQAGTDTVVSGNGQKYFYDNLPDCDFNHFLSIPGAKHELLLESDMYRIPALTATLRFFHEQLQDVLNCSK